MNVFDTTSAVPAHSLASSTGTASTGGASGSTSSSSTITSSDFLTLLVTELKNQDPTQPTDPAQYVQQLVGVNSLEQLIDVNKQLSSLGGSIAPKSAI